MGVTLYKDLLRFINEELGRCTCLDTLMSHPEPGWQGHNFLRHRINLLERKEELELLILKQLGWA